MIVYEGMVNADGNRIVTFNGGRLSPVPSQKLINHSPDGFSWGYGGSGPAQLSLAILLHHFENPSFVQRIYQDFKWKVVAQWPMDGDWKITGEEIDAICAELQKEN